MFYQRVDGKPKIVRQVYLGKIDELIAAAEQSHTPAVLEIEVNAFDNVATPSTSRSAWSLALLCLMPYSRPSVVRGYPAASICC